MSTPQPPVSPNDDALRKAAKKRIQSQRAFYNYLAMWAVVSVVLIGIWALSGRGYFWPIWVIGGMAIAALFMALGSFGPRSGPPNEDRIQQEIRKMQ